MTTLTCRLVDVAEGIPEDAVLEISAPAIKRLDGTLLYAGGTTKRKFTKGRLSIDLVPSGSGETDPTDWQYGFLLRWKTGSIAKFYAVIPAQADPIDFTELVSLSPVDPTYEPPDDPGGATDAGVATLVESGPLTGAAVDERVAAGIVDKADASALLEEAADRAAADADLADAITTATTGMETTTGSAAKVAAEATARANADTANSTAITDETSARVAGDAAIATALTTKADLVGGTVPASQLPSYVDDVLSFANLAAFPAVGEDGKIYIAKDTNLTYRWSGSAYGVLDPSLALGETASTAYRGDRGKTAYDHSQVTSGNPHGVTKADVGLGSVNNTADSAKPVSTAQAAAIAAEATARDAAIATATTGMETTTGSAAKVAAEATARNAAIVADRSNGTPVWGAITGKPTIPVVSIVTAGTSSTGYPDGLFVEYTP